MNPESAFQQILETGLLGAFLVLTIGAIVFLYRENQRIRDARLQDLRDVWNKDMEMRKEIKYLLDNILQILKAGKNEVPK
jgi:hypothetical protein